MSWLRPLIKSPLGRSLPPVFDQNTEWGSMMPLNPDLGKKLSAARHGLGASIQDISRRTHIPENAIRHLEKGQFSEFPSVEYAVGFLAQYSDYLGLPTLDHLDSFATSEDRSGIATRESNKNRCITRVSVTEKRPLPITGSRNSQRGLLRSRSLPEEEPEENQLPINKGQPLIVFSITSILIACSLFAYMRLSGDFDQEDASATQNPSAPLGEIGGLSAQAPMSPVFSDVPRALPVSPESTLPPTAKNPGERTKIQNLSASNVTPALPFEGFSLESPPPRAVIVEE
ncbi:MAG: hypothetical protein CMN06_08945 [Roseibacillus sp.]|nr:hypothetical protein [Roseibacillus sp.]